MFTGREYDSETDLYSYRARMYSPVLDRFLQPDPIGNADSMNLYQYCGNNPVNWIDPEGFERISIGIYPVNSDPRDRFLKYEANFFTTWTIGATDPSDAAQQMKRYEKMIDKINKGMGNISVGEVFFVDHGSNGSQRINGSNTLDPFSQAWKDMCNSTGEDCSFILTGCNVAGGKKGREYLQNLADEGNRTVYAWDNPANGNYNEGTLYKATPMGGAPEAVHPGIEEGDPSEVGVIFRMIDRFAGSKRVYRNY